jgi:hypothetical protein
MFNEFLTSTLQVVLVLDVVGVIAYFVLSAARSRTPAPEAAEPASPSPAREQRANPLWHKLIGPRKAAQAAPPQAAMASIREPSLDSALGQLRRVLDSYRTSLA